ncbi:3'-5' exonuclease [bacterium]|nr:3'-5' exonuclease [bacterium]
MYIFFDTETTGKPERYNAPLEDLDNWPRMVQLAWLIFDKDEKKISEKEFIIKPGGFIIPEESTKIHKITTEKAIKEGFALSRVLQEFSDDLKTAEVLIAHNIGFDEKIVGAEFIRKKIANNLFILPKVCTMTSSTDLCKLPSPYGNGYKWPKLPELHNHLFKSDFAHAHNALYDVKACAKCFFELKKQDIIKI